VIYIQFFPYCLFVNNSQVIGCEDHLRNDLYCVGWGIKLYSIQFYKWGWNKAAFCTVQETSTSKTCTHFLFLPILCKLT